MKAIVVLIAIGISVASGKSITPADCVNCNFNVGGIGFLANKNNCNKFIQCQKLADGSYIAHDMSCAPGTYWIQTLLICGWEYDNEYPCPVTTTTTTTTTTVESPNCTLVADPNNDAIFYETANGMLKEMPCAPGTVFVEELCMCDHGYNTASPCEDDPMLYFPFTDHTDDIQCHKAAGTPVNYPSVNSNGLCLDGQNKVEIGFLSNWFAGNPTRAFTISMWFNQTLNGIQSLQGLFGNGDCNATDASVLLYVENLIAKGQILTDAPASAVFPGPPTQRDYLQGDWVHIAMVYTGLEVNYYVNGNKMDTISSITGPITNTQVPTNVGMAFVDCVPHFFTGCICDLRIYVRALSDLDVQAEYDLGHSCNSGNGSPD